MANLLAGVFAGIGMIFSGWFGGHHAPPNDMGSSTPPANQMMGSTTAWRNGTSTPDHMGMAMPGVFGKVVSVSGTSLTVTGKSGGMGDMNSATTTYSVDASSATVMKVGTAGLKPTTSSVSDIQVGDTVAIMGTVSGTDVTAKNIIDGVRPFRMMTGGKGGMRMHPGGGMSSSSAPQS